MVIGAGALGSLFGGLLSQHNDVTLVGREQHMEAIQKNSLGIIGATELVASPKCVTNVNDMHDVNNSTIPDLIILGVKAHDTEKAVGECASILDSDTRIITFQNGLGNVEAIERVVSPSVKVIGGITSHGATSISPGIVKHGGIGETKIGWPDGHLDEEIMGIASMFTDCGIEASISTDIRREIWAKAIVNSAINPITALQGEENGCIVREPVLSRLARAVVKEGVKVANGTGQSFGIDEVFEMTMKVVENTSDNRSSMLQDIDNHRRTEIDRINGKIISKGRESGIPTPINDALVNAVKDMETGSINSSDKTILSKITLLVP